MNTGIIVFNLFFYTVTFILFMLGKQDPGSSLGYAIFIAIFWGISTIALIVLLAGKIIRPQSTSDKIGVFTATPVLLIAVVLLIRSGIFA